MTTVVFESVLSLFNLGILWINFKLYTEILKDRNSELRRRGDEVSGEDHAGRCPRCATNSRLYCAKCFQDAIAAERARRDARVEALRKRCAVLQRERCEARNQLGAVDKIIAEQLCDNGPAFDCGREIAGVCTKDTDNRDLWCTRCCIRAALRERDKARAALDQERER